MEAEIGARIRARMRELGVKRRQLAEQLTISEAGVAKILSGENVAQFVKLAELARCLRTTPNDLLGFGGGGIPKEDV